MFGRLKRLWELSGTLSDAEDTEMAAQIKQEGDFYRKSEQEKRIKKGQRLATIIQTTDPFEGIPNDEELENDNANK